MGTFKKKPVEIEAIQFTGNNWSEIETFVPVGKYNDDGTFQIITLEGEHKCSIGDWVIKGVAGEFYPCKPEIFAATYEPPTEKAVTPLNDSQAETLIQQKNLTAPRLTPDYIKSLIKLEQYHRFENTTLTVCYLTLQNGYTVTGESACLSTENYDEEIGCGIAKENAIQKIWMLEGYLQKQAMSQFTVNPTKTIGV